MNAIHHVLIVALMLAALQGCAAPAPVKQGNQICWLQALGQQQGVLLVRMYCEREEAP